MHSRIVRYQQPRWTNPTNPHHRIAIAIPSADAVIDPHGIGRSLADGNGGTPTPFFARCASPRKAAALVLFSCLGHLGQNSHPKIDNDGAIDVDKRQESAAFLIAYPKRRQRRRRYVDDDDDGYLATV
ncbi:transducin-like protein [Anopheles sinensis]|uniref:Transducin-like protein n=1 Tax=Anopheles sinensis TaxID=74873 RepID=A0A084WQD3_ANOSI|nr:transducin-like protein [Anopheles sinensis]